MAEQKCNMCRLCLGLISGCDKILLNNNQYWIESIFNITGLKVVSDPGQFEYLCSQCQSSLEQCVQFRVACIYNDGVFREMMRGSNHIEDCNFELQKSKEEFIKLEPVDLGEPTGNATEQLERCEVVEPSIERSRGSQKDNQKGTDVSREMMTSSNYIADCEYGLQEPVQEFIELKPVDLGESTTEVSESFENNHLLPPEVVEPHVERERKSQKQYGSKPVKRKKYPALEIECLKCGSMVKLKDAKEHQQLHHPQPEKLRCPQCPKEFPNRRHLNWHIDKHRTGEIVHTSDEGGQPSISRESPNEHPEVVHSVEKGYECTVCGEKFRRVPELLYHARMTHSTTRPFACQHCNKSFKTKAYLKVHTRSHMRIQTNQTQQKAEDVPTESDQQASSFASAYMRYLTKH